MSDMSRPSFPPPAPDHERHDALLVAQFVAGDPLKPEQQAEARRLIASCGGCATLAADLPAVSRAVAHEPTPPRRRDFRLSPEQAEELRGNALTRFLRRLSLPSSRAFQPAAAGVLSIGLLFVVAGYAWPEGGTIVMQAEPNLVDRSTTSSPAPADEPAAPAAVVPSEVDAEPRSEAAPGIAESAPLEGAEVLMDESDFADTLAESQAGTSDRRAQKSRAEAYADDVAQPDALELEALEQELALPSPVDGASGLGAVLDPAEEATAAVSSRNAAQGDRPDEVDTADADDQPALIAGADASGPDIGAGGAETVRVDDDGVEELLIVLGLALALGGAGLLLLGWLARRARDPLAP